MSTAYITTFAAKLVDETSIKLTWTGSYSSVSVYQSTDKDKTYTALAEYTETSSYTISSLTPNTVYFFYIIPYDSDGEEGTKKETFITTPYNIEITSFYAGSPGMTSIPLYWDGIYYNIRIKYKRYDQSDDYITDIYPITGTPSYIVTGLDVDTSYNFQIIPYDLNDFSGTSSDIIYTKTDYLAYVGNIDLGSVTASTVNVSWDGWFSYVALQYSTDNSTFDTKSSVYTSNGGSYTFKRLDPLTQYYFRAVPYDEYYNVGTTSTSISGETLAGFTSVSTTSVSYNTVVLTWDGSYSYVEVYQSSDGGETYDLIDTVTYSERSIATAAATYSAPDISVFELTNEAAAAMSTAPAISMGEDEYDGDAAAARARSGTVSLSYTVDGLTMSTDYKFYLLPYYNGVLGTSSEIISVTTDYNPDASFSVGTPTIYSIPLVFSTDGLTYPYYTYCHIELSTDDDTYYDVSYIYQVPSVGSPFTYYITDYSGATVQLVPNYTYYFRVTPYSNYGTAGDTTYYGSHATLGNIDISTFDVTLDSNIIKLNWSGYFYSTYLEYTTNDFTGATDVSSVLVYRSSSYADNTTDLVSSSYTASSLSSDQTYYFRLKPVNYDGDIGAASASRYNATITGLYLTDITSTTITLNWVGIYSTVTVQSSTDGSTYSSVSGATDISSSSVTITTSGSTLTYYRIIPYSATGAQGRTSSTAYIPTVSSPTLSVTDVSSVSITWSGTSDYADIIYSTDNSTYSVAKSDATSPASVSFYGMDASDQTYFFKVVPYGYGYPTSTDAYDVSGISSSAVYNATISTAYFSALSGSSVYNSIKVHWKGTYAGLYIYYDVCYNFPSNTYTQITTANSGSSLKKTTISSLLSDTTYYFKLVPYNSNANNGLYYPIINATTSSLLTGLNFAYNSGGSSSSSIRLTWRDNNYYYIRIYGSDGTSYGIYYSTTNYLDITGLSPNTKYTFYAVVYDTTGNSETTSNVTAYTSATTANLGLTYETSSSSGFSINPKKVIFSWDNSGYYSISIQNTTNSSSTTTYYSSDGTTSYDSFSAGEGNLVQNTYYTYLFTLKNAYGSSITYTQTVTTLGTISAFDISKNTFTASQIPIEFTGIYNYVIVDVSDGVTRGNTYIYGIGSKSSSVYTSYNLTSSNSIISAANKTYWVTVYPANDASNVGLSSNTYSAKTLGAITRFYSPGVLDNSSIALYWDGSYAEVTLESATNSGFSTDYVGTRISTTSAAGGAGSSGYTYNGLQPNTKYYFRVTPVNQPLSDGTDVSGVTVTNDISGTTLGKLTVLYTAAYYDTSAVVAFDGSFASIDISVNSVKKTYTTARTTALDISNLTPGSTYTVTTLLRNSAGATVAGNSISFTTRSKITGFSATALDSSSISVAWTATGTLSYVTLVWNTTGGTYSTSTDSNGIYYTSPAYISGLALANARYYFQITPTSSMGDGYIVKDASDITWGKLNSFYVDTSNISATSIPLIWEGSFNHLIIQQSLDGTTYVDASSVVSYDSSGTTLTGLYNNTMYYIRAVPVSDASAVGTATAATTGTTLAYIGSAYASDITSSTFKLNVDLSSSSYSSFYVLNTTDGGSTSAFVTYPDNSITLTDLSANTSYTVVIYAYNYNAVDGSGTVITYTLSDTTTLATIEGAATANVFTDLSSGYYSITLYGEYTSFKLQYALNGVTYNTSYANYGSKITVSDLSANTTYTYTAYANNKSGGAGTDVSENFTVTTLGSTPSFNAKSSPNYSQVNSITFDIYQGEYSAVRIKTSTTVDMSSGLLYTVDISNDNISSVLGNVYVQRDLSVNTKYYFNSTPINSAGETGNASTTLPLATLGNLTAVSLRSTSDISAYAIPVSWSGAYNTMLLEYATAAAQSYSTFATYSNSTTPTSTNISANVYVTGLSPNTAYYFRATSYSLDSLAGTTLYITDVSAMTLPTIDDTTITTTVYDTSAVVRFDGSFAKVRIYSSPASLDKTYNWSLGGINTGTDISGLTANTSYTFYYVPYNTNNVSNPIKGTPVYSSTFYTQPRITSNRTIITDSSSVSIAWAWSGSSTSATTQIATSTNAAATTYSYYTVVTSAGTSSTVSNLEANTQYYFELTPKAQSDTSGYTVYIKDTSAVTLGNIMSLSNTTTSDVSAAFAVSGAFSGLKMYNPASAAYTTQTATNSATVSLYGLTSNASYVFSFYPRNSYGVYNNIPTTNTAITTLGNVTSKGVSLVRDSSSITLKWGGYYTSMNIYTSTDNSTYTYYMNTTNSSADISGLAWNTRYYFNLIPVNSAGTTGRTYNISDTSAVTLGNISAVSSTIISDVSAVFAISGLFSGVRAYNIATSAYTEQTATNSAAITLYGLSSNTSYAIPFYPKNSYNTYNITGISKTITTLGNIISCQPKTIHDNSAVTIGWSGNYSSVNISYSTDGSTYKSYQTGVTGNSLYIKDLSANQRYYFSIVPVNSAATTGLTYYINDVSATTMGNVTSMNTAYVGYSELSFNLYGYFSGIKAHNTTNSTITYYTGNNYVGTGALTGLSPNTEYTYKFYARNSFGYYSNTYHEKKHYTTPNIATAYTTTSSSSALALSWAFTGSSNSNVVVHVYKSSDGSNYTYSTQSNSGSTSTNMTGLSANEKYYIRLIPKGYSDTSGSNFDISGYTYGSLDTPTYSNLDASSVKITVTGTFTKARVYNSSASFNTTYTA